VLWDGANEAAMDAAYAMTLLLLVYDLDLWCSPLPSSTARRLRGEVLVADPGGVGCRGRCLSGVVELHADRRRG
jgi:hypothetical protein